jgi:hypothetical protein
MSVLYRNASNEGPENPQLVTSTANFLELYVLFPLQEIIIIKVIPIAIEILEGMA